MGIDSSAISMAVMFLMAMVAPAFAKEDTEAPTPSRNLEYKLEIGQHERLIKTRNSVGVGLAPFVSDGCSGGLSLGWALVSKEFPIVAQYHGDKPPWESCCLAHDQRLPHGRFC